LFQHLESLEGAAYIVPVRISRDPDATEKGVLAKNVYYSELELFVRLAH
jgi:hypothetical protein